MIAFWTTLLSSSTTTRSREFICASSRLPAIRIRIAMPRYTTIVRSTFSPSEMSMERKGASHSGRFMAPR